eukprot:GEMP01036943.1.p1 GENE.GEMP01036943.1~~GEMP01036943.1.p1  ORF type:complete len:210 (+),score=28.71 GEMP01036943.1:69-698(+)
MDEYRRRHQASYRAEDPQNAQGAQSAQGTAAAPPRRGATDDGLLTQRNLMLVGGAFALGILITSYGPFLILLVLIAGLLRQTIPADASFDAFFKTWFLESFYPQTSKAFRQARWGARRNEDPISSVIGSVKAWMHEKTEGIHGSVVYEVVRANALPPRIDTYPCWKFAYINANAFGEAPRRDQEEKFLIFVGIANRWFPNPLQQFDFDG